jgi:hypothetical protein
MKNWQTETSIYVPRLQTALRCVTLRPPIPANIPPGPLGDPPSFLQSVIHRAATFYELGVWYRTRETMEAIIVLWREGYVSSAAALTHLVFELWGASHFMTDGLRMFDQHKDIARLAQVVDRLYEGVRSEVLLPWGTPASEKPIHVLDTIRSLSQTFPDAMVVYETLCESAHANQPRFMEWWLLGTGGDNWTNETVQSRGHTLITKTVDAMEKATIGIKTETEIGMKLCGELY